MKREDMNTLQRGLFAALVLMSSTAQTALQNDRTFIAHHDDIANIGMDWVTKNHYQGRGDHTTMGASLTVTPFHARSTNHADLARLFGMADTGQVKLPGQHGQHGLQCTPIYIALILITRQTQTVQAQIKSLCLALRVLSLSGMCQEFISTMNTHLIQYFRGLRFIVQAPLTEVSTTMGATFPSKIASAIPASDGTIADIDQYFKGDLTKVKTGDLTDVAHEGLRRQKFDNEWHKALNIGDVITTLRWNCYNARRFSLGVSASLQLPFGTMPTGGRLFEPIAGGRGHTAVGLGANLHLKGLSKGALSVAFDLIADWKYRFKSDEKRTLSIYDQTEDTILTASAYRNVVKHLHTGVRPAANVMTVDVDVTPGHRFDGLVGMSATWYNWHFDVGYNFYWSQQEKLNHALGKAIVMHWLTIATVHIMPGHLVHVLLVEIL